jgi:hypothetical protein
VWPQVHHPQVRCLAGRQPTPRRDQHLPGQLQHALGQDRRQLSRQSLRPFVLADLLDVGIQPEDLQLHAETPCRFWAHYELSEKLNAAGNPYKDVIALEPVDKPATTTSTDTSPILAELRAIRALLQTVAEALDVPLPHEEEPEPSELDGEAPSRTAGSATSRSSAGPEAPARYGNGEPLSDNPHELKAYQDHVRRTGNLPRDVDDLREWVKNGGRYNPPEHPQQG